MKIIQNLKENVYKTRMEKSFITVTGPKSMIENINVYYIINRKTT